MSDQMKVPGTSAKNVEERNIPWSQQVDEALYENLTSPSSNDNEANNPSSMQFQYPPFNAKESRSGGWNKPRKTPNSYDNNQHFGRASFQNTKRDDLHQPNAWGVNNSRRQPSDKTSGNFTRTNKFDDGNINVKMEIRQNSLSTHGEKTPFANTVSAPKKTTWASIASQPAKLTSRTTLTTSSQKKKGPGMPPPPMVPGKHNMDVNAWDVPNINPPPVPSPPPPIELSYEDTIAEYTSSIEIVNDTSPTMRTDSLRDENKSNYISGGGNSFGRVRNSPNGHLRKNWPVQQSANQSRHQSQHFTDRPMPQPGPTRRTDGNPTGTTSGRNAFDRDRKPLYGGSLRSNNQDNYREDKPVRNTLSSQNSDQAITETPEAVLEELCEKNNYNPADIDMKKAASARFFVIKSYSEDDIHRSIKYEIWCSTDHGNKRLDEAFKERQSENGNILLFFSVNRTGHFCGMAQMMTPVDYNSTSSVWSQDKWKGKFKVKWIYVKDVPNTKLRHIRLENNENKSVTNSRDAQEVPNVQGIEVLQILHSYKHSTSIFDDFSHYEKKQEEEVSSKKPFSHDNVGSSQNMQSPGSRYYGRQMDDRDRDRDRDVRKYFVNSSGSFRDRHMYRSSYNNYGDNRRYENNVAAIGDREHEADSENTDYGSRRFDNIRNDDTFSSCIRERDMGDDQNKKNGRHRSSPREIQKDNDHQVTERIRTSDY